MQPLPIDPYIAAITELVKRTRRAVIVAPPGSGKTTRVPPALLAIGKTILLQPRRVAARALARRIAAERHWMLGREIGWQIRFERNFSADTRLLVATEGVLTARLQADQLLSEFSVVILDEFHERSIYADLALALVKQAVETRDDLAVVVMSATMDARPVADFIGAEVIDVETQRHPLRIEYRAGTSIDAAVLDVAEREAGDILCFLPGAREIDRAQQAIQQRATDMLVLPLHGSLDVDAQERALLPASRRKVILATNVAETSLTVEGVAIVVDAGLQKVARYDPETAVDHLETEMISRDSADQRAGRAGRTGPGVVIRLWDERTQLRPHREPEIRRVDLASTVLDIIAWGDDPRDFAWYEEPPQDRLDAAIALLEQLGAIDGRRLTAAGEMMRRMPLHPRLARLILSARGADEAIAVCAVLSEDTRKLERGRELPTTRCDVLSIADRFRAPAIIRELTSIARRALGEDYAPRGSEETLLRAILAAYPDRVAVRRAAGSERLLLASGTGAALAKESGVREGDFLVALDVAGGVAAGEALVRMASFVDRDWLQPNRREIVHSLRDGRVRAMERQFYGAILLREVNVEPDPAATSRLLAEELVSRVDPALQARVEFAGLAVDWGELAQLATSGSRNASDVDLAQFLPWDVRKRLDELAPPTLPLPSGRSTRLDYRNDGSVVASVKLQELFGLAETPRIGPKRTPVTIALLSPAGRPVQVTQDLRSFWNTTYYEVRSELRARYPRHPWPDDPWNAVATHRTVRRKG